MGFLNIDFMNLIDVLTVVISVVLGLIWLNYQIKITKKYKKEKSYSLLSTQPSQYIGVLILVLGGALMIYRAF